MSVKFLRGIFLSVLAVMVLSSSVWAASPIIDPDNKNSGKSGGDYELERELEGGIHLVVERFFIAPPSYYGERLCLEATVTSEEDTVLSVARDSDAYDSNGNRYTSLHATTIGNEKTDTRKIIGGVPTKFYILYDSPSGNTKIAEKYPSVTFSVNGKELTFRDVPGKN